MATAVKHGTRSSRETYYTGTTYAEYAQRMHDEMGTGCHGQLERQPTRLYPTRLTYDCPACRARFFIHLEH